MGGPNKRILAGILLKLDGGVLAPATWLANFSGCRKAIAAHAAAALATGDEDTFTDQVVLLLAIGRHLRATNILLGTVVGCGFEKDAYQQITDLAPTGLKESGNRTRLVDAINGRSRPLGEEMAAVFRFERATVLNLLDQIETGAAKHPAVSIPSRASAARRRVLLARNRLALCEDSQRELLAPGGRLTAVLKLDDLVRYEERNRRRFKTAAAFETIAAGWSLATGGVAGPLWRVDVDARQTARKGLRNALDSPP